VIVTGDWWRFFSSWISSRRSTMFGTLCCWKNFHFTLSSGVLRWIWLVLIFQIDISVCLWMKFCWNWLRLQGVCRRVLCWDIVAQIDFCRFYMYANDVQLYLSDDPCSLDECIRRMNADLDRLYIWATELWEISGNCDRFSRISCCGCSTGFNGDCNNTFLYESEELGTDH
jgi:hypothetical protein